MIEELTLGSIIRSVSSGDPTPGGGHVSALAGSLGASLYLMVINLTLPKKDSPEFRDRKAGLEEAQVALLRLAEKDSEAYEDVLKALCLPKASDEEKARRRAAIEEATKGAALVPLETARVCMSVMRLGPDLLEWGKKSCMSDTAVGFLMAHSGFEGAAMNVNINLASIQDEDFKSRMRQAIGPLREEAKLLRSKVLSFVGQS
jgi:formiminotetrahydrofolate cyclodeaminase